MKEENKRKNIKEELSHADESLHAARVLIDAKLFRESISKLYYAMFHALRALLFTKGLEPKSHGGVRYYFNTHFVKPELFPQEYGRFFNRLMKYRHEADYGLACEITKQDCNEWLKMVVEFMKVIRKSIKDYCESHYSPV